MELYGPEEYTIRFLDSEKMQNIICFILKGTTKSHIKADCMWTLMTISLDLWFTLEKCLVLKPAACKKPRCSLWMTKTWVRGWRDEQEDRWRDRWGIHHLVERCCGCFNATWCWYNCMLMRCGTDKHTASTHWWLTVWLKKTMLGLVCPLKLREVSKFTVCADVAFTSPSLFKASWCSVIVPYTQEVYFRRSYSTSDAVVMKYRSTNRCFCIYGG